MLTALDFIKFIVDCLLEYLNIKKKEKQSDKIQELEKEIIDLKSKTKNEIKSESTTYEELLLKKKILGYYICTNGNIKEKKYFEDLNDLLFLLEQSVFQRCFKLKEMYLFEFDDFEILKIKNALSDYGHQFIRFQTNTKDSLLIKRREEIRAKTNYYKEIKISRNNGRKKMNEFFKKQGMNKFVLPDEITVDIEKEQNKGMESTYIGFK